MNDSTSDRTFRYWIEELPGSSGHGSTEIKAFATLFENCFATSHKDMHFVNRVLSTFSVITLAIATGRLGRSEYDNTEIN